MAPEVMLGLEYDNKCDVFSYAMVLYELLSRDKPPQRVVKDQFGFPAHEYKSQIPRDTPEELWNLLVDCADREPANRPEFKEIIRKLGEIQKKYDEHGWPDTNKKSSSSASSNGGDKKTKKPKKFSR